MLHDQEKGGLRAFFPPVLTSRLSGNILLKRAEDIELSHSRQPLMTKAAALDIFDDRNAVVTINGVGEILHITMGASRLWGHTAGELIGRNVSNLIPQPFSDMHDMFLRSYIQTGKEHIINQTR